MSAKHVDDTFCQFTFILKQDIFSSINLFDKLILIRKNAINPFISSLDLLWRSFLKSKERVFPFFFHCCLEVLNEKKYL